MVNDAVTKAAAAERDLALGYAPRSLRAGLAALFALDARLGDIVRTTRDPLVGQMRLTWWRDALAVLDTAPVPAEPVLAALAAEVLPLGLRGGDLAAFAQGWEQLLVQPLDHVVLTAFANGRGAVLFEQAALLLTGVKQAVGMAGEGWALADLAGRLRDRVLAEQARTLARERLASVSGRWSHALRPLGALALLARADLDGIAPGSPRRITRLLVHRLTGR